MQEQFKGAVNFRDWNFQNTSSDIVSNFRDQSYYGTQGIAAAQRYFCPPETPSHDLSARIDNLLALSLNATSASIKQEVPEYFNQKPSQRIKRKLNTDQVPRKRNRAPPALPTSRSSPIDIGSSSSCGTDDSDEDLLSQPML